MTTFTSTTNGNLADGATYGNTSPGVRGTDFPGDDDVLVVDTGDTVTMNADATIGSLDIKGTLTTDGTARTLTLDDGGQGYICEHRGTLSTTINLTINSNYAGDRLIRLNNGGNGNFNNVSITLQSTSRKLTIGTEAASIDGNFTITQGIFDTDSSNNYALTVTGDIEIADGGPQLKYNDSTVTCARLGVGLGGVGKIDGTEAGKIIVNGTGNVRILDLAGAVLTGDTVTFEYQGQATTATQALSGLTSGVFNLIVNSDGATEKCIPNASVTSLNDLTLTDGEFELPSSTNIEAAGDLIIQINGVADLNPASSDGNVTFRSVVISSGGTLEAPSHGSFTLTGTLSAWSFQNNSTNFNHNNGTITQTAAGHIKSVSTNPFYNFTMNSSSSDSHEAVFRASSGTDVVIAANDVTVTRGIVKLNTVSDTASMAALTIGSTGTFQASSGTTTIKGNFDNSGTFTHNDGTIKFNHATNTQNINEDGTAQPTFYKLDNGQPAVGGATVVVWKSITVVHTLSQTGGRYFQFKGDQGSLTVTLGSSSVACTVTEGNRCLATLSGAGPVKFYGADQLKPFVTTTGGPNHACTEVHYKWGDLSADSFTTQHNITIDGDMKFGAVTVANGDSFDINGQRVECTGTLTNNGEIDFDGMIYAPDLNLDGTTTNKSSGTVVLQPTSAVGALDLRDDATLGTLMINAGTNRVDIAGTNNAASATNLFLGTGILDLADKAMSYTDINVATDATLDADSSTITCSGDFTMSGGLIGKSAVIFDGTDDVASGDSATGSDTNPTDNLFVEAWWKSTNTTPETTSVIGKESSYLLYINASGYLQGYAYGSSSDISISAGWVGSIFDEKWHHIAMGYSQAGGLKIWLDGRLVGHNTTDAGTLDQNANGLRIMRYGSNYGQGTVAMGRIWTGAVPTDAQLRSNMFKGEGDSPAYTSGVIQSAWYFDEGTGTTVEDVGVGTDADLTLEGSPAWAGAGGFTGGTSTLKFNKAGTQYITYLNTDYVAGLHIAAGSTTIMQDIVDNNHALYVSGNLTVSGTLQDTSQEYVRIPNNFVTLGSAIDVSNGDVTDIQIIFDNAAGTSINLPASTWQEIDINYGTVTLTGDVTVNNTWRARQHGSATIKANGNTMTVSGACNIYSGATLDLTNSSTLLFNTAGGEFLSDADSTLLAGGGGVTIKGYTSGDKTDFDSQNDFKVVGTVENLNVTNEELSVTGKVINCSGDIIQQHQSVDAAQQLDYDSADDRDIMLGRDLDKNTELVG